MMCVQGANDQDISVGRAPNCFPGDATLTRADAGTGKALGPVRMDEVAIGDAVVCLVPVDGVGGDARDGAQAYVPGVCRVFYYMDADKDHTTAYVALHYTDEAGRAQKLRASAEHLVYLAPRGMEPGQLSAQLPPGGAASRADMVRAGDLLAVRSTAEEGSVYAARVTAVTREVHRGMFAPALTNAGLLLVDGAATFSWVHLVPGTRPHPMQNVGEYLRHSRVLREFDRSLASGCQGAACPCLDAPEDPSRRCARLGDKLADLPAGMSDFTYRSKQALFAAQAEGRTKLGYETGIRIGRAYHALPWLTSLERALGFKPHTIGLWVTNKLLTAPPRQPTKGAGAAEEEDNAVPRT